MKKRLRRAVPALIALMLLVMPFGGLGESADIGQTGVYTGNANVLKIGKEIIVTNTDREVTSVFGPKVTYSYSVAPAEVSGLTVTDSENHSITIRAGVAAALSVADYSIAFSGQDRVTLENQKGTLSGSMEMTFTPSAFEAPGVYRYKVQDTTSADSLASAGILRKAGYSTDHFLDVYVGYDGAGKEAENLQIQGYVLSDSNSSITSSSKKQSGYDKATDGSDVTLLSGSVTNEGADTYPTVNVTIGVTADGNMADASHPFPFTATVGQEAGFLAGETLEGAAAVASPGTFELSHGETYRLVGLSPAVTLAVAENDNTTDGYQVTCRDQADGSVALTEDSATKTYTASGLSLTTPGNAGTLNYTGNVVLNFHNALQAVSPTGLVLRFFPYVTMLLIAFVLFAAFSREKGRKRI